MIGLINAGILAGLAALAIPVIIHLLRSRRFVRADLGTLRFLREALQETSRWRRLQQWLLLLARLLIVALLTFLFARPFLKNPDEEKRRNMEAVALVDASGSMEGQTLGARHFDLAREAAGKLLRDAPPTAKLSVAAFSSDVWDMKELQELKLAPGARTDYGRALLAARDRLALSKRERKMVFLFTDMQKTGLPEQPLPNWPLDCPVKIMPSPQGIWNASITAARCPSPYVGSEGAIEVQLGCYGDVPEAEAEVTLEIQGEKPIAQTAPLRSGVIIFKQAMTHAGILRGVARVKSKDAYPSDNARPFAFSVQAPHRVLLVNGAPGANQFKDETYYLQKALEVAEREEGQSAFAVEKRESLDDVAKFGVVALCNVAALTEAEIRRLQEFLDAGGGLIYFLGDRIQSDACAEWERQGVFPARIAISRTPVPRQIWEWDTAHPALGLFNAREQGDLSRILFRDVFDIEPTTGSAVLARLSNGVAALVEKSRGKGRILLVANPCDRDWSDWPATRMYVPLIRELFNYLAGELGAKTPVAEKTPGPDEARAPGVYDGDPAKGEPVTVVAGDPREADIRGVSEAEFRAALGIGPAPDEDKEAAREDNRPVNSERKREWWRYLAYALLVLLFAESFLTDRRRV
ncbi:MAG: BatA domain-containing protein [Candidatus Sumerlaeota bacterium]|nr:BatA domain-containing protein [Candidatus Sumerlaeota bacterium]